MTEKIREFLQQKRWLQLKKTDWIAVALVGVLLLVVAMPSGGTGIHLAENKKEDTAQEKTEQKYEKEDYAEYLEHKLEQVHCTQSHGQCHFNSIAILPLSLYGVIAIRQSCLCLLSVHCKSHL